MLCAAWVEQFNHKPQFASLGFQLRSERRDLEKEEIGSLGSHGSPQLGALLRFSLIMDLFLK